MLRKKPAESRMSSLVLGRRERELPKLMVRWASIMAPLVRVLAAAPDICSSIPETHMEKASSCRLTSDVCTCLMGYILLSLYTNENVCVHIHTK